MTYSMGKTVKMGPFLGIDNRAPDQQLRQGEQGEPSATYLRDALNVDITDMGTIARRRPITRTRVGQGTHSLWSDAEDHCFVDGSTLFFNGRAVRGELPRNKPVSYVRYSNGHIYWSNGVTIERLVDGVSVEAAPARPNPAPTLTLNTVGALPEGMYQVSVTVTNASGEESPPSWPQQIFCPEGRGLLVEGLPSLGMTNVYLSTCNGDVLFHYCTTVDSTVHIETLPRDLGRQLMTAHVDVLPAGTLLATFNARLLSALGSTLYLGEAYAGAMYRPLRGFIPFPDRITMLAPLDTGFFVGTKTATYWCSGRNPDELEVTVAKDEGVVLGTCARITQDRQCWRSASGVCLGASDGSVINVLEKHVAASDGEAGATVYREYGGLKQYVSVISGAKPAQTPHPGYRNILERVARKFQ